MSGTKRGRGRPRREYRIRVRGERRERPDYEKLARALLEHAAIQSRLDQKSLEPDEPANAILDSAAPDVAEETS